MRSKIHEEKKPVLILCFLGVLCGVTFSVAQDSSTLSSRIDAMGSLNWREKLRVVDEISQEHASISEQEKRNLLQVFEKDVLFRRNYLEAPRAKGLADSAPGRFSEENPGYDRYVVRLAHLASSWKDAKTVPLLLTAMEEYGGAVVPSHITSIGPKAVYALLDVWRGPNERLRRTAIATLSIWVHAPLSAEDYTLTPEMAIRDEKILNLVKTALLEASDDSDGGVRLGAVYGLEAFPEAKVVAVLRHLQQSDPYYLLLQEGGKAVFPVRERAKEALEKRKAGAQR